MSVQLKRPYRDRYEARLPELLRSPRKLFFFEPIRSVEKRVGLDRYDGIFKLDWPQQP